jgi:hypothetical protein
MRNKIILGIAAALIFWLGAKAQATAQVYAFSVQAGTTVANCPAVASGVTSYCYTAAGAYQSINGATWTSMVSLPAPVAGVTSVNGRTGAVTITATTTVN